MVLLVLATLCVIFAPAAAGQDDSGWDGGPPSRTDQLDPVGTEVEVGGVTIDAGGEVLAGGGAAGGAGTGGGTSGLAFTGLDVWFLVAIAVLFIALGTAAWSRALSRPRRQVDSDA